MLLFDLHNVIRKIAQSYLGLKQLTEEDDDGEVQPPILSNIDYKIILFSIFLRSVLLYFILNLSHSLNTCFRGA